jgi:hypothetical protein
MTTTVETSAVLIAFPVSRQIGRARDIANRIFHGSHSKAQSVFTREARLIARQLGGLGIGREIVDAEIRSFTDLVNSEIASLFENTQRGTR